MKRLGLDAIPLVFQGKFTEIISRSFASPKFSFSSWVGDFLALEYFW